MTGTLVAMLISPLIRFGTSTWTYEGWQGQVYKRQYAKSAFSRGCLGEYCQYQYSNGALYRTVGNDSTFYRPPTTNQLLRYLNQIPEDFEMCCKVWEEITIPRFASHLRYGVKAGQSNSRFLDAKLFNEMAIHGGCSILCGEWYHAIMSECGQRPGSSPHVQRH
jgi:uncharacterized protein YecE (DUF72 family)